VIDMAVGVVRVAPGVFGTHMAECVMGEGGGARGNGGWNDVMHGDEVRAGDEDSREGKDGKDNEGMNDLHDSYTEPSKSE